jgi:beta-glucanase (GH16 family)
MVRDREGKHHRQVWLLTGKIIDPARSAGDYFGSSVSVSGGVAVMGAVGTNNSAGAAYVAAPSMETLKGPGVVAAAGYQLKFNPSFAGTHLNTKVWATCYPWVANPSRGCTNYGHTEYEWYLPAQVQVSNGALHLVAKRAKTIGRTKKGKPYLYYCRSGMVTTNPSFKFEYGIVQVVANMSG